jgi:hypothetical protein
VTENQSSKRIAALAEGIRNNDIVGLLWKKKAIADHFVAFVNSHRPQGRPISLGGVQRQRKGRI